MSVDFDRGSPGKFDSRALNRETLNRGTGRMRRQRPHTMIVMKIMMINHNNHNDNDNHEINEHSNNDTNDNSNQYYDINTEHND